MRAAPGCSRATGAALVLASGLLVDCGFPTDQSGQVFVTIEAPTTVVVRGESVVLHGAVWQQREAGAPVRLAAATIDWTPDQPSVASLVRRDDGSAVLTGINRGIVHVQATARDYKEARAAGEDIRVSNTVEVDSVLPGTVRYGGQVTVYGVGLGHIAQVALGETSLIPDPSSFSGDPEAAGWQRFWVPYPAVTGRVLATASEGFSAPAASVTEVIPRTVYFSSDGSPATVLLDNRVDSGAVVFDNPALALTPEGGGNQIHFLLADTTRPLTISISTTAPVITSMVPVVASGAAPGTENYWNVGTATSQCGPGVVRPAPGLDFGPRAATVVRTFEHTPSDGLLVRVDGASPGRFAVRVSDGFPAADPRILPDRFEENNSCLGADSNSRNPATAIDVAAGFADTLTIDQGYQVDWFRFTVPRDPTGGFNPLFVTARAVSRPFAAADSSDLGLGLVSVDAVRVGNPQEPHIVVWQAESHDPGSSERVSAELDPGDYYLVVSDEAGVATRYGLCIALGNDCIPGVTAASAR
jgi:hypothetical protein